jgi:hypothetical protein
MSDTAELTKDHFIELLKSKEFKQSLVKELNECVDIPIITEKTEKKIMNELYNIVLKVILSKIDN